MVHRLELKRIKKSGSLKSNQSIFSINVNLNKLINKNKVGVN